MQEHVSENLEYEGAIFSWAALMEKIKLSGLNQKLP